MHGEALENAVGDDYVTKEFLSNRLETMEGRIDAKINSLESRIDARIDSLESRMDAKFDRPRQAGQSQGLTHRSRSTR